MGVQNPDLLKNQHFASDYDDDDDESIIAVVRHPHGEEELYHSQRTAPDDKFFLGYISFLILGMGILFPWNTFLTSSDYFDSLYPKFPYDFIVSLAYNYPSLIMLMVSVKWGSRLGFSFRILLSFVIDLVVLFGIPLISKYVIKEVALTLTFVGVFFTGVSTAILFGAVMGMSALFPPTYTGAVMAGNGWAGIVPAVLRIITKASFGGSKSGLQDSATLFFALCAFVILICIVCELLLPRLPFAKFYLHNMHHKHVEHLEHEKEEEAPLIEHQGKREQGEAPQPSIVAVFKQIWQQAFLVFFVFFVTLSLFPGVTSLIKTHAHNGPSQSWFQLILVTLFMIGDLTGRTLPRWFIIFNRQTLWYPVIGRVIFFPLFIFCITLEPFKNDYIAYVTMLLFALSNGYTSTLAMMFGASAPDLCDHEREMAGTQMSFFLNLGIFTAIHFAILLLYLITGGIGF